MSPSPGRPRSDSASPSEALPDWPWPASDPDVDAALAGALADGSWGRYEGRHARRLERELRAAFGAPGVYLCASGTIAVELALRGLKIGPGDEVLLAAYDFSGNFRAIEAVGARPVLVDIRPETWCLDERALEAACSERTRAVIASHLHGGLVRMDAVRALARERDLAVVEDACQCPGAVVGGLPAGAWGDIGVLSFGGSKLLTAGRGGALLVKDEAALQRVRVYCERGNHACPLSELQAAVLPPQLAKLAERNARRRAAAAFLRNALSDAPGLAPLAAPAAGDAPTFYKLPFLYQGGAAPGGAMASRAALLCRAQTLGVPLDVGFAGFVQRPSRVCRKVGDLPCAAAAAERTVLLHHPVLLAPEETLARVAERLRRALLEGTGT